MRYLEQNVLDSENIKADIVAALNFSYCIFKTRKELLHYFTAVRKSLAKEGLFIVDIFGGTECYSPLEEETEHKTFSYFWDCDKYNPITNECLYKIHFEVKKDKTKYEDVFVYDWRQWSIPEIKEVMLEAGFQDVSVYWEGDDDDGGGDGEYYVTQEEENCESWVSYLVAKASS